MSLPNDLIPDRDEARRRQQADPLVASAVRAADDAGRTCPDAELLGLYAERALARDERAIVDGHLRDCARCQAALAAIARALPEAAGTADLRHAPAPGWLGSWRWLMPMASLAAVAVVAVWMGRTPQVESEPPRSEGAFVAPPAEPAGAMAGATASAQEAARQKAEDAPLQERVAPEAGPRAIQQEARPAARQAGRGPQPAAPRAEAAPGAEAAARAPDSALARSNEAALADARVAAAPPALGAAAATPAPPAPARERDAAGDAAMGAARAPAPATAFATTPSGTWRVNDGRLERTTDGGGTWRRVPLPFAERVAAVTERPDGSVVVTSVSGTRVVTTDGGATWRR